ncbi:hypothetical protein CJ255_06250 [Candidatus Viridilinea mediisalina]|uniref:Novel STAND NTPase 1 domain-containing protein n=1 Tax=Candidatus Viridilinea mediisalina TaxID=2024553 RepID=A0A2A6RLL1_9CHLR|nr:hypothetical protein [Candidatus Viridilinea mediisalina]PDW03952.1 hypothetical protein CJ255_06250 [Candidatus Viridilinea mediisalina]
MVDALLGEILGEPAALPLLQYSLLKLWEARERNRVTWAAYQQVGGGRLALGRGADAVYQQLIPEDQKTAERIFLRLVRPSEGIEMTSMRVRRAELVQGGEDPSRVERVLTRLIDARLLRLTSGESSSDTQVEIAHEALIRNWPTLSNWLEDERHNLRQRQRLTERAEQWQRLGQTREDLLQGQLLEEAQRYPDLNQLERDFVQASSAAVTARLWNSEGQALAVLRGHSGDVYSAVFSPDGTRMLTASADGTARQYMVSTEDLRRAAVCRVNRELTPEEVQGFEVDLPLAFTLEQRQCPPVYSWQR